MGLGASESGDRDEGGGETLPPKAQVRERSLPALFGVNVWLFKRGYKIKT